MRTELTVTSIMFLSHGPTLQQIAG